MRTLFLTLSLLFLASPLLAQGLDDDPTSDATEVADQEIRPALFDTTELARSIVYPTLARELGEEATVILTVYIAENGEIDSVELYKGESLNEDGTPKEGRVTRRNVFFFAAHDAVLATTFRPTFVDGKPIKSKLTVTIDFRLTDPEPTAPTED